MENLFESYCDSKTECKVCPLNNLTCGSECEKAYLDITEFYKNKHEEKIAKVITKLDEVNEKIDKMIKQQEVCESPDISEKIKQCAKERMFL